MKNMWIVAQTDGPQAPPQIGSETGTDEGAGATTQVPDSNASGPRAPQKAPTSPLMQFLPLILIMVVMYLLLMSGPRKKQQRHKQMVLSLKINDRVRTIGGIMGTVVDVRDDEVILKIDESNNIKIKVSVSAIGKNLSEEGKD